MTARATPPNEKRLPRSPEKRLWFGVLAAPAAWTLHEVVGYAVVARGCMLGDGSLPTWAWSAYIGISLLAVLAAAAGGWVALAAFRRATGPTPVWRTEGWGRMELMGAAGVFISAALLLNIVLFGIMPLFLDPCRAVT